MATNYNPQIVTDGLVLYLDAANQRSYPGSGTVWTDLSGNGNNGTLINGPTYNSDNLGNFSFDGVNDYVSLGQIQNNVNIFTWNIWMKTSSNVISYSDYYQMPVLLGTKQASGTTQDTLFGINNNKLAWYDECGGGSILVSSNNITDGVWHNVLAVRNTTVLNFYFDGNLINTRSCSSTGINSLGLEIAKANWSSNTFYSGNISLVSIYNRVLSADEIKQNFNALRGRYGI